MGKLSFSGQITSIQPRIRLTRSFDEVSHTYLGYAIKITGTIDDEETTFSIGIGKAAQSKFNFKVNDIISGVCLPVPDPDMEPVDYYKVSKLAKVAEGKQGSLSTPWELVAPELEVFRDGPLSCKLYKAGPNRRVEGRGGMVYVEEDWVDEANVAHRGMDE